MGLRLSTPKFNGDPSGGRIGRGPGHGEGQGMPKITPRPELLGKAGLEKGA